MSFGQSKFNTTIATKFCILHRTSSGWPLLGTRWHIYTTMFVDSNTIKDVNTPSLQGKDNIVAKNCHVFFTKIHIQNPVVINYLCILKALFKHLVSNHGNYGETLTRCSLLFLSNECECIWNNCYTCSLIKTKTKSNRISFFFLFFIFFWKIFVPFGFSSCC